MKLITLCLLLALAMPLSANPFTTFWGWLTGRTEPPCIVNGVIADRNDTTYRGPVCDKDEWNAPPVLEAHLKLKQMANVKDWNQMYDARKAHAFKPTTAQWSNGLIGLTPISAQDLSSRAQAERYKNRLEGLAAKTGMSCSLAIHEQDRDIRGGFPQYGTETRRVFFLHRASEDAHHRSGQLVSTILLSYMTNSEETADERMMGLAGVRFLCAVPSERLRMRGPISK